MAKAKAKALAPAARKQRKTASSVAKGNGEIPSGMRQLAGSFAPTWNPEEVPHLRGTFSEPKSVTLTQGKKQVERRCVEFTTENDETFTVWESAGLVHMFEEVEPGTEVFIRYDGLGTAKKGQNAPKLFTVAVAD